MLDRTISFVLLAVSGACLWNAVKLAGGMGGLRGAALPLGLSLALGVLSLALLAGTFRPAQAGAGHAEAPVIPPERRRQSLTFFGLIVLYVAAIQPLGFLAASLAAGTLVLRFTFREPWWKAVLIATVMAVLSWGLFREVLHVPLPTGSLLKGVTGS